MNRALKLSAALFFGLVCGWAACAAVPEIAAASITAEYITLVYGAGFDGARLEAHVQVESKDTNAPAWGEAEIKASLQRVLAGKAEMPKAPNKKDRGWQAVLHREANILAHDTGGKASSDPSPVKVLRLRNEQGVSAPFVMNRPEIWGASPRRPAQGEQLTVWGVNIGRDRPAGCYFALADEAGQVAALLKAYSPYHAHSIRPEGRFYRLAVIPADLAPGKYRLFCWMGFGDLGWSEIPYELEACAPVAPRASVANVKDFGALGDGASDDTKAFKSAIAKAAEAGGGRINVPAGRYIISESLILPENTGLYGLSLETTALIAVPGRALRNPELTRPSRDSRDVPFVRMISGGVLSDLTLDVSESLVPSHTHQQGSTVIHSPGGAGMTIRRVAILDKSMRPYGEWPDLRVWAGLMITGNTEDLTVENSLFSIASHAITCWPSHNVGWRLRYNTFTTSDPHIANALFVPRTLDSCLIEGNKFINGGRAKTEQAHGVPYAVRRNFYVHNTFENMRKGDGELLMYEAGSARWFGKASGGGANRISAADAGGGAKTGPGWQETIEGERPGTAKAGFKGFTVTINQGRGVGQFRTVVSNTHDTLTVDRPWRVTPDDTSVFTILWGAVVENLHVGNEFFRCHCYAGIYGSGLRNVWVNEIYEAVSGGLVLWPINGPRIMSFNLIYANKYYEQGGVMLQNGRGPAYGAMSKAMTNEYPNLQKMVGNEVRGCSLEDKRYTSTENGQIWTSVMRDKWARQGRSSPFMPVPGNEAALAVWDTLQWANYPEDPGLDKLPASSRWNLLLENQVVRCPTGVLIGKAVERTVVAGNAFYETPRPILDLGRDTIATNNYVHGLAGEKY
ncbi:MAG: glycosyl hydrolase family 28-related protein [Kiritimatiellota bacterium]|nr:glycosyl hydrolase family 28-related protein [Kiritimatiellota bacterium]